MPLLFLGTAQDGGVPQAGCRCINCRRFKRSAASIALVDGENTVLIDITPDFRLQYRMLVERFDAEITAVYLTHAHWGHYGGLPLLGNEGWNASGMPVYLSHSLLDFLSANEPFGSLLRSGNITPHVIEGNVETSHGITPVVVKHRGEFSDTFAFLFKVDGRKMLYMPDADDFEGAPDTLIRSVDIAIIDGTFWSAGEVAHRDIDRIPHPCVMDTIRKYRDLADRIVFTHFNHTNPLLDGRSPERSRLESLGFRAADDGDVIG